MSGISRGDRRAMHREYVGAWRTGMSAPPEPEESRELIGLNPGEEEAGVVAGDGHVLVVGHFAEDVAFVADLDDGDLVEVDEGFLVLAETLLGLGFDVHEFCLKKKGV